MRHIFSDTTCVFQIIITKPGIDDSVQGKTGRPELHSRQGQQTIFLFKSVQTDSGAHPASYPMDTRSTFAGRKAAEA
jgi:hypothetical protein